MQPASSPSCIGILCGIILLIVFFGLLVGRKTGPVTARPANPCATPEVVQFGTGFVDIMRRMVDVTKVAQTSPLTPETVSRLLTEYQALRSEAVRLKVPDGCQSARDVHDSLLKLVDAAINGLSKGLSDDEPGSTSALAEAGAYLDALNARMELFAHDMQS